jgi:autotransporter-associated beta strand protein
MKPRRILSVARLSFALASAIAALLAAPAAYATTLTWDATAGGAIDDGAGAWLGAGLWNNGAPSATWTSGDDAIFGNGGTGGAVTLASPTTVKSLTFNSFSGTYTLGTAGRAITLNNGITMNSGAGIVSIISPITLGAAQSWTNNDDSLLTTGGVTNGGFVLTIGGTGNTTVSSAINGSGGLTKNGTGTLTLSAASFGYTGLTTVNAGTLLATKGGALKAVTVNAGATLQSGDAGIINDLPDASVTINGGTWDMGAYLEWSFGAVVMHGGTITGTSAGYLRNYQGITGDGTNTISQRISILAAQPNSGLFNITGGTTTVSGVIYSDDSSVQGVTKTGAGTLVLANSNTYTGTTVVSAGTLQFAKQASLYNNTPANWTAANINVKSGATLALNVDSAGTAGFTSTSLNTLLTNISVAGSATAGLQSGAILGFDTGTATGATFTQGNLIANSTSTNGGAIGVTKLGSGTLVLDKANTYTGTTTVSGGNLAVNGSLAIASSVTVQNGGTLQGSGSIGGSVTIQNGGKLATGNSIESLATGALSLQALATFAQEINNDAAATVAGDLTAVTGNLTIDLGNAAILTLTELGSGSWSANEKLTLISYSGTWNGGLFNYGGTLADDSTINFSGATWQFNYNDTVAGSNYTSDLTGTSFVTMTVIPEPRAALLGGLGLLMLLRRRR